MSDIKLTPTRAAVLRGVSKGQVLHSRQWDTKKPDPDVWTWTPGAQRTVTADMKKLRDLNLVRIGRALSASAFSAQTWELTEAGEQWLADNPEEH
ncbi:MAG TPA: hypothetical protein VI172_14790 [Candidatus Dormibacteraeota bacterium]|jgi:hypothetical protein